MPSRNDVARESGVSGATVSYVLNNTPGVSIREETRKKVIAAAAALGYRPSMAGRALRDGHLKQLGVLAPFGDTLFVPYHEAVLRGVWRACSVAERRLVIDTVGSSGQMSFIDMNIVDGVVGLGLGPDCFTARKRKTVREQGFPVVLIGGGAWCREVHTLDIDNLDLGNRAADLLVSRGHRKVLAFGGDPTARSVKARREGFIQGLAKHGIALTEDCVISTALAESDEGYRMGLETLPKHREVTAAFCFNDALALGLMRAARDLGLELPRDLSVLGVDAEPMGEFSHPRLCSFRQPLEQMGEDAVHLLLAPPEKTLHRFYPFELVEGESVGWNRS